MPPLPSGSRISYCARRVPAAIMPFMYSGMIVDEQTIRTTFIALRPVMDERVTRLWSDHLVSDRVVIGGPHQLARNVRFRSDVATAAVDRVSALAAERRRRPRSREPRARSGGGP